MKRTFHVLSLLVCASAVPAVTGVALGQHWLNPDDDSRTNRSMFRQIEEWPDPNVYRNAAGAPGPEYWQQRVDYVIDARLDTVTHSVAGSERITYHNNSPDDLSYIWIQLDQNIRSIEHSRTYRMAEALPETMSPPARRFLSYRFDPFDGGYELSRVQVQDSNGGLVDAKYRIRDTQMKVHLVEPVASGANVVLEIDWSFRVPDSNQPARGQRELVRDGWLYEIAQWFPRVSVYDDVNGWQTDQFLGQGEFYLNFGDYEVSITVPRDHIVDATGVLQNPQDVLTDEQRSRLERAYRSDEPVFIIRPEEVMKRQSRPAGDGMLTWRFRASDVRDFAWVSSRTYVWDAAGFTYGEGEKPIAVHSLYPRDAMPLWDKVSTRAVLQTLATYGKMSLQYPYPKATNVHGPVFGMEYPMVAFCGARPAPDGTYSDGLERALISVTIHEVGHNWFPMIIASDERKWTWMDEGLNSFVQYYAEQDYARNFAGDVWTQTDDGTYPSRRGPSEEIVDYMRDPDQVPIMTESDLIHKDFGNNGYAKPASGLVMLRESVVGEEIFDEAFREYSERWAFKHPQPADFFRSMEEGTGENLAWFWRGWFYSTHANDQAIASVTAQPSDSLVGSTRYGRDYYRLQVENRGGLLMPLHIEITYDDGSTELVELPVDVWRSNERTFTRGFFSDRSVTRVEIDPNNAFADIDRGNNVWEAPAIEEGEQRSSGGSQ